MFDVAATGFLLSLSLCLDLGVVNVALIQTALQRGPRPALALGLGSAVGDLIYAFLSVAAITVVLEHRGVRLALWLGGTSALAWLALRMIRESIHVRSIAASAETNPIGSDARYFARGVLLALASPSAILWFAAVGGSVIAATAGEARALGPFMIGFALAGMLWAVGLAVIVGRARRAIGPGAIRAISLVSAALFVYLAAVVFVRGYREFVG
ncbi:MAG: LysE family translocator [Steroidobacteraceae bacterium]